MENNYYLQTVLNKYIPKKLDNYVLGIYALKVHLMNWGANCSVEILDSGSRAKGTAISISSDVDYMVSLSSFCNDKDGGLKEIYESLHSKLKSLYNPVRKQNVSFRIKIIDLEVDITPARKQANQIHYHSIYVSKFDTWKQTNIQKHILDISSSGRINEIKLLKIWRAINNIDFPSIYLEYLVIEILKGKSKEITKLSNNFIFVLQELSKDTNNPLYTRIVDPANSSNILSDLLNASEKKSIISTAIISCNKRSWSEIIS